MDDEALLRYSRHLLLPEWSIEHQQRLADSCVVIVGMGGLGCAVAPYLASSGVGRLVLLDFDTVSLDNLQRQILYRESDVGRLKVEAAASHLQALNASINIHTFSTLGAFNKEMLCEYNVSVVVDCTDNFSARYAINQLCCTSRIALVSGAAVEWEGLFTVFDFRTMSSPCYHCLFPDGEDSVVRRCATTGIFAPLVGMIGSLQASETLKLLLGIRSAWQERLLRVNLSTGMFRESTFKADSECKVCVLPTLL